MSLNEIICELPNLSTEELFVLRHEIDDHLEDAEFWLDKDELCEDCLPEEDEYNNET